MQYKVFFSENLLIFQGMELAAGMSVSNGATFYRYILLIGTGWINIWYIVKKKYAHNKVENVSKESTFNL